MAGVPVMRGWRYGRVLAGAVAALALAGLAVAQYNEREVKPRPNVLDPDEIFEKDGSYKADSKIWALEFKFKDPRFITADVPGRGKKICLYLWYQVINKTREPHTFIPDFELVTLDKQTVHHDEVLPAVQEEIRKLEDLGNVQKIKNSVTIAAEPIPPARPDAAPRPVTGVAIWVWDDAAPDTTRFSIFVSGLSNGWSLTDGAGPNDPPIVRRKTLQLNFRRPGDRYYQHNEQIQFLPPAQWIYRGSKLNVPGLPGNKKKDEKADAAPQPEKKQ